MRRSTRPYAAELGLASPVHERLWASVQYSHRLKESAHYRLLDLYDIVHPEQPKGTIDKFAEEKHLLTPDRAVSLVADYCVEGYDRTTLSVRHRTTVIEVSRILSGVRPKEWFEGLWHEDVWDAMLQTQICLGRRRYDAYRKSKPIGRRTPEFVLARENSSFRRFNSVLRWKGVPKKRLGEWSASFATKMPMWHCGECDVCMEGSNEYDGE